MLGKNQIWMWRPTWLCKQPLVFSNFFIFLQMQDMEGAFSSPYIWIHRRWASDGPYLYPSFTISVLYELIQKNRRYPTILYFLTVYENISKSLILQHYNIYFHSYDIWIFAPKITIVKLDFTFDGKKSSIWRSIWLENWDETIVMICKHCVLPSIILMIMRSIVSTKRNVIKIGMLMGCNVVPTRSFTRYVSVITLLRSRTVSSFWRHTKTVRIQHDNWWIFIKTQHHLFSINIIISINFQSSNTTIRNNCKKHILTWTIYLVSTINTRKFKGVRYFMNSFESIVKIFNKSSLGNNMNVVNVHFHVKGTVSVMIPSFLCGVTKNQSRYPIFFQCIFVSWMSIKSEKKK